MSRPRGYLQLPVELVRDEKVTDVGVALWCVLADVVSRGRRLTVDTRSRDRLLRDIGRPDADPHVITRALKPLCAGGWLQVEKAWTPAAVTRNVYTPLRVPEFGDGQPFLNLPRYALELLGDQELQPAHLRGLARWLDACGREGRTRDSVTKHARVYGRGVRSVREHRGRLLDLGLLAVERRPGRPAEVRTPAPNAPTIRRQIDTDPGTERTDGSGANPGTECTNTPAADAPPPRHQMHRSKGTTSRKNYLPRELPPGVTSRRAVTERSARETPAPQAAQMTSPSTPTPTAPTTAGTGAGRARRHPDSDPVLVAVLERFDPMPTWVRAHVLDELSEALSAGYGPRALVRALQNHFSPAAARAGQHTAELAAVLAALRSDVLAGACQVCGQDPAAGARTEVCPRCNPDDQADVDPAALERARAQLGAAT